MVLGVAAAALALAAPVFGAPATVAQVPWSGFLGELEVADLTGDGNPDVIECTWDDDDPTISHPVVVLAGDGHGGFKDVSAQVFVGAVPRTQHCRQIVFADFNRDGRTDAFIADHGYDHPPYPGYQNQLILSAPGGKLVDATANLPQQSDFTHSAAAADVNGDGAPDIYVGNLGTPGPDILLNDGTGHFHALAGALPSVITQAFATRRFTREAFADVNGDGTQDLVLLAEGDSGATRNGPSTVLLNDGTGHFSELPNALPPKPFGASGEGLSIAATDLNGDGKVDLLAGYSGLDRGTRFYTGRYIQILINNGDGTFRDETAARAPQDPANVLSWPQSIRVGDFNGDGKVDFAVSIIEDVSGDTPPLFLNRGDGTFAQAPIVRAPYQLLDVADVNHDGKLDIVSAGGGGRFDTYAVSLQQTAMPKPKPKKKPRRHHP